MAIRIGTDASDDLRTPIGNFTDDFVWGGGGGDLVWTYGGDDEVHGGGGKDTILGGDGNDWLYGYGSNTVLFGFYLGISLVHDDTQKETLSEGALADWDDGDFITGGSGNDHIWGGAGDDTLYGSAAAKQSGSGDDYLHGGYGHDTLFGGDGQNTLLGGYVPLNMQTDIDVAEYLGVRADYEIFFDGVFRVGYYGSDAHLLGDDSLQNVEALKFADGLSWLVRKWGDNKSAGTSGGVVTWGIDTASLSAAELVATKDLIGLAFKQWSDVAGIKFAEVPVGLAEIAISFEDGVILDGAPVNGKGNFPHYAASGPDGPATDLDYLAGAKANTLTMTPESGDIVLDKALLNNIQSAPEKLFLIAVHEIGHSIGLDHVPIVDSEGKFLPSIMNKGYESFIYSGLQLVDVAYAQAIYGPVQSTILDGSASNDTIVASSAFDQINLYSGSDAVIGSPSQLDGDTIFGFGLDDTIVILGTLFSISNVGITYGSAILNIDTDRNGIYDTTLTLEGDFSEVVFQVEQISGNSEITISVLDAPNSAPVAYPDVFSTDEDSSLVVATSVMLENDTDTEGDTLTVSEIDTTETLGLVTDNGNGTFTYNPNGVFDGLGAGESAIDNFSYTVSDGNGGTDTATVVITVEGRDEEPKLNIVAGTSGRDILSGTVTNDVFLFRGGFGDVGVGNGGDDTFDFTESLANGLLDSTRIADWSEGDMISGIDYNEVHMETVRSSSTTLRFAYGPDRDVLTITGDVSTGLAGLFDTTFV